MADTGVERRLRVETGGATLAAILGAGALVLALLGLASVLPMTMVEIATIAIGAGLMIEGSAASAQLHGARARHAHAEEVHAGRALSTELFGGVATVILGVLALIGLYPMVLIPIAAIVAGGSLLVGGPATERVVEHLPYPSETTRSPLPGPAPPVTTERETPVEHRTLQVASAGARIEVIVGIGAVVLGVLALTGMAPMTLSLVAMLALGVGILIGGGAIGARIGAMLHER